MSRRTYILFNTGQRVESGLAIITTGPEIVLSGNIAHGPT
jgi:hypothetical protein